MSFVSMIQVLGETLFFIFLFFIKFICMSFLVK